MLYSIQSYLYKLRTDSIVRKKFFVTLGIIAALFAMLAFIIFVNTRDRTVRNVTTNNSGFVQDYRLVSTSDFDISQGLEQVYGTPVQDPSNLNIDGSNIAFINTDYNLVVDGEIIDGAPTLAPRSVYATDQGTIVNSLSESYLYSGGEISEFIDKAHSVVPSLIVDGKGSRSTEGYMFILSNQSQLFIFESRNVFENANVKQVAQFSLREGQQFAELRVFNNEPYLVTYDNISRTGSIDVWHINSTNRLVSALELEGVESISFSKTGLVYSVFDDNPSEISLYETRVIDFLSDPLGAEYVIDIQPELARSGAFGTLYAQRCTLNTPTSVVCLVKIRKVLSTIPSEQDKIIEYDFVANDISYPYQGIFLSGEDILYDGTTPYVIGQENGILYRLDSSRQ